MKKALLLISSLVLAFCSYGQNNESPNRAAFKLTLAVNDTNYFASDIKESAYILKDNTVQIYPGESIFIEADFEDKTVKNMHCVKSNIHPEKTITISFDQKIEGRKPEQMILKVQNPFDAKLEYKAHIYLLKQKRWVETDVLPVRPKIIGFETWHDIIVTIALSGWKLQ
jgi:hypothetical protein